MAQLNTLKPWRQLQRISNGAGLIMPTRNAWYKKDGSGLTKLKKGGRDKKIPHNWRDVDFNPANIPQAWKPADYDQKNTIKYERELIKAKYIPGFKPKIRAELRENYHEEPLYQTRFDEDLTVLEQMLALTKARLVANELPQKLLQHADKLWDEKEQKQQVIDVMQHVHLFDVDPANLDKSVNQVFKSKEYQDNKKLKSGTKRQCNLMAWEFMRIVNMKAFKLKPSSFAARRILEDVPSVASFTKGNTSDHTNLPGLAESWKVQVASQPQVQMLNEKPLEVFATSEEVERSRAFEPQTLYPALPICDMRTTNHYEMTNMRGFRTRDGASGSNSTTLPQQHFVDTLIEYNHDNLSSIEFQGRIYKSLFASLHSQAVDMKLPVNEAGELEQPLTAQCIGLDGKRFYFMCFQLNTMTYDDDSGVKNMAWLDTGSQLFDQCDQYQWKSPQLYTKFDPRPFKLFQAMWLNGIL